MPHKNRRNLFEEHIESDDFDVSRLGLTYGMSDLSSQVSELLSQLPRPFDYRIWDQYLDERQKLLCAQLTFEIIDHVIREQHLQETIHLSDDDLVQMLTVPSLEFGRGCRTWRSSTLTKSATAMVPGRTCTGRWPLVG